LAETVELLNSFHLKEVEAFKGFDPEGTFSSHLSSIGYGTTFARLPKSQKELVIMTLIPVEQFLEKRNKFVMMIWSQGSVQIPS
jgi:hypothetical protein